MIEKAEDFDIVGKKKLVIDSSIAVILPRVGGATSGQGLDVSFKEGKIAKNAVYLPASAQTVAGVSYNIDNVRLATGKAWEIIGGDASIENVPLRLFGAYSNNQGPQVGMRPIELDACEPEIVIDYSNSVYEQTVILSNDGIDVQYLQINDAFEDDPIFLWIWLVKSGFIMDGVTYNPIVNPNATFYDHYHEAPSPFLPSEAINKQPSGKTFTADFSTYYNERINSNAFETFLKDPKFQNSIPSLYDLLALSMNTSISNKNYFNLEKLIFGSNPESITMPAQLGFDVNFNNFLRNSIAYPFLYNTLFKKYAHEASITLFGSIGYLHTMAMNLAKVDANILPNKFKKLGGDTKVFEKILTKDSKLVDYDGLFNLYIDEYVYILSQWTDYFELIAEGEAENTFNQPVGVLQSLENINTNLILSPSIVKNLKTVEKYKKYFPFYAQLEFTAKLKTEIGDFAQKMLMNRFLANNIAAAVTDMSSRYSNTEHGGFDADSSVDVSFSEFVDERHYTVISGQLEDSQFDKLPSTFNNSIKKVIPIDSIINEWVDPNKPDYFTDTPHLAAGASFQSDIRNFVTFFRDGLKEPINLDNDDNAIWKTLFGNAFRAKLHDIYKLKRRKFEEIISGKPAYSEDLFYRIEKLRKLPGSDTYAQVKNIFIPNTSDLDIVTYIDTELKYHDAAHYKYKVYAERIVFGTEYRYYWTNQSNIEVDSPGVVADPNGMINAWGGTVEFSNGCTSTAPSNSDRTFEARFKVELKPSIKIVEDMMFETADILIMDRPPVPPDVDILPYRAVNNRLKILLSGTTDRFRAEPVILLDSDQEQFNKVIASQLSYDGKVEFGSDDPVGSFQIFRTQDMPRMYTDFKPYKLDATAVFEETILPNTKYYYLFRSVDSHGHVSNPGTMYEVELISEKGAVKPLIRAYEFPKQEFDSSFRECQKYIYLKPNATQLLLSDQEGLDSIFSQEAKKRKFKMRLTSKSTGKKIDINFSFAKKNNSTET